jgi:competence protein ComEC
MITIAAAGALGIVAEQTQSIALAVLGLVVLIGLWRFSETVRWRRWAILMMVVAITAAVRSRWDESNYQTATVREFVTDDLQPAIVVGKVSGLVQRVAKREEDFKPGESPWMTRFNVDVSSIRQGAAFQNCHGRLWVSVDSDVEQVGTGDTVRLSGKIAAFMKPTNPGETDMRLVARNLGQHGRLFVRDARQVEMIQLASWGLNRLANRISLGGEKTLMNCLGEDTGALAAALVVGRRGSLAPELQDQLLETGTIHLLSVSGLHMGIVAMMLRVVATSLGLRGIAQILFVGGFCLLFVAVTGGRPPVLRAAMLVAVVMTAAAFDRQSLPLNSLAAAAVVLMLINPTDLTRVGVQLSFVAVATLVSCGHRYREIDDELRAESQLDRLAETAASPLRMRLRWVIGKLNNALWFSLCVTLTTTPLVWMHFNLITPIAVFANVVLGVPMTVALLSGLVAVVCGTVSDRLAYPAGEVCYAALWIMQRVIDAAADFVWGHAWLPGPPAWWVAVYYVALVGGFVVINRRYRARSFVIGSIAWCMIAWWLAVLPSHNRAGDLRATFIDVGHGTSVILNLPDGRNMLYDCGSLGNKNYSSRGFHEPLWAQGITSLDAIILSHADADHYNAVPGLLRRFRVDEVVVPTGMFDSTKVGLEPIRQAIASAKVPVRELSCDDQFFDPSSSPSPQLSKILVLHPPPYRVQGNDNANSLVLRIDTGGRSLVLPGDLEPPGLEMVLNRSRPLPGGVLMAPHHGSLTVDSQAILDWARPRQVIVSGGDRAKRPEVAEALRVRGSDVFVTAEIGAIQVTLPAGEADDRSETPIGRQSAQPLRTQTTIRAWLSDPW